MFCQQEMANPKVRPHLHFYPEDAGVKLSEARQGSRWLHELLPEQTTPMVRIGQQDYYIHEPAMLRDGTCCMPIRWFQRGNAMYAKCWELDPITTDNGSSWRVIKRENYEVPLHQFLKTFPELREDAVSIYSIPDPTQITGLFSFINNVLSPPT